MGYRPLPTVAEDFDELQRRLRTERDPQLKPRIHLLVLIKTGKVKTRQEAAEYLALHRNTVARWLSLYQQRGFEGLLSLGERGAPTGQRCLPAAAYEALRARLRTREGFRSYVEVQRWLKDEFGLEVPYQSVYTLVHYRLKAKLKRARPSHAKKTQPSQPASSNT